MASFQQHLANVKSRIEEVSVEHLAQSQRSVSVLLDVRERDEYEQGYIPGATHVPRGKLELQIEGLVPQRDADMVVYCAGGNRSALAASTLEELGYTNVRSLAGGFTAWKLRGGEVNKPFVFTQAQTLRYARHFMLPQVGQAGQAKLLGAKVLLLGAGGLGSPAALYLAAVGVGTLGIVDDDVVESSNLQRQVLHSTQRVGTPKVDSAAQTIEALNPDVKVVRYPLRLVAENALQVLKGYDVIIDGTDNFPARYLLNDASLLLKIPVVSASIFQFEGQVTVLKPYAGPCYRCIYPESPPPGAAPSCNEAGVLGVLPGVIGVVQATETVKLILGMGRSLVGRLLQYDALEMRFREFKAQRDPNCPACSQPDREIVLSDNVAHCLI